MSETCAHIAPIPAGPSAHVLLFQLTKVEHPFLFQLLGSMGRDLRWPYLSSTRLECQMALPLFETVDDIGCVRRDMDVSSCGFQNIDDALHAGT